MSPFPRLHLREQALAQVETGAAGGVEPQDLLADRFHFVGTRAARAGQVVHRGVEIAALVEVADDVEPDGALRLAGNGEAELLPQVFRQRPAGRKRPLQRGRLLRERQPAGVIVVLGEEVPGLDLRHRVLLRRGGDLLGGRLPGLFPGSVGGPVGGLGLGFRRRGVLVVRLLLALEDFLERRVLHEFLLDPHLQFRHRHGEHLDGLADLRREGEALLLPDDRGETGLLGRAHRHSNSSPR